LIINMQAGERLSLEQIRTFLEASNEMGFQGWDREEVYSWVNLTLRQQRYEELKRSGRGLVRRYLEKMTGLSRAQTTRLITMYVGGEEVRVKPYRRYRFPGGTLRPRLGHLCRLWPRRRQGIEGALKGQCRLQVGNGASSSGSMR
jgi:hypothetical protein